MNNITTLGIDLAKNIFQLHGTNKDGKPLVKKSVKRDKLLQFILKHVPENCVIGLEACGSAHFWAREFSSHGYQVKIMPPQFVKPYVKGNKNDAADAEACNEAVGRKSMRFVPIKTERQQDIQALHRARELTITNRIQVKSQTIGLLLEYGITVPNQKTKFLAMVQEIIDNDTGKLSFELRELLADNITQYKQLTERELKITKQLTIIAKQDKDAARLMEIKGIGPIIATAMIAAIGENADFKNGRQLAAFLGLVPKHYGTGGKVTMGGITKRGNKYLRQLLVHGARSLLVVASKGKDNFSAWINKLLSQKPYNKVAVAVANKLARVIWVVLIKGAKFDINKVCSRYHENDKPIDISNLVEVKA